MPVIPAHKVDDQIDTTPPCFCLYYLGEIFISIVDCEIRPKRFAKFALLVRSCGGKDLVGPCGPCYLNSRLTNAGGRRVD